MIRFLAYLLLLFSLSVLAICAGYYSTHFGMRWLAIELIFESVPVIRTSIYLVFAFVLNLLMAFYTSNGRYSGFQSELMALNFTIPPAVAFWHLPGVLDLSEPLGEHYYLMWILIVASQCLVTRLAAESFWRFGGRYGEDY